MEGKFNKLKIMQRKANFGIYCEDLIILSCLKQIISKDSSNIEILETIEGDFSHLDKIFVIGTEKNEFKKENNFVFINNFEELLKKYSDEKEEKIDYLSICISLGKVLDLINNIPIEKKTNLLNLSVKLGKSLNFTKEKIEKLKLAVSLRNIKNYLIDLSDSKHPYSTRNISPTRVNSLIYELFNEIPKDLIYEIFEMEDGKNKSDILKIIDVCSFYLENKDKEILRKEAKENLDPYFVEKLIEILEEKKIDLGKKILILDSDSDSNLIKLRLENQGFKVFLFENPLIALKSLNEMNPDLIISNVILSSLDGFSFLDKIKMDEKSKKIPFIFLSQKSDSFSIKKGLSLGAIDFIPKPFDLEILVTKIYKYLSIPPKEESEFRVSLNHYQTTEKKEFLYDDLEPNYIISNRFQILKELSEGGMGKIFLAKDLELKEEIVLKFLKKKLIEDRKILEKFKEEVKITRKLTHHNIVRFYDFWDIGELKFITQEYVEGKSLRKILSENGPPPIPVGLRFAKGMTNGFSYAHSLNVIHRDIKPENIIITKLNEVKILDFGIAKIFEETSFGRLTSTSGEVFGTPEYMSPEQLSSKEVDERSDIYSLGILFYEMFCGQLPFLGKSKLSIALMHLQKKPTPPTNINPKIPLKLENIILKMIEKEKEKRYSSMEEVKKELEKVII